MKLTDLKGVGKATAEKLEEAGYYSIPDLEGITVDKLVDLGVSQNNAANIVESVEAVLSTNAQNKPEKPAIQYHIMDANKFRIHAFKQSKDYDPDNLEESYNSWWIKKLKGK